MISIQSLLLISSFFFGSYCSKEPVNITNDEVESASSEEIYTMLSAINALRASGCRCGGKWMASAPALKWDSQLEQAALGHARDMNNNGFFDHTGSDGSSIGTRVKRAGYNWGSVGENIAWGYEDVPAVVEGWRVSAGHCENFMNPTYQDMGAAYINGYWVQTLARH